jgi:hypothetical protein
LKALLCFLFIANLGFLFIFLKQGLII